jgi:CheY-like chemotaxis protein
LPVASHQYRLLVCDDSTVERLALAHLLRRTGYEVDEAADGASAMSHLKYRPIDLLLLDLQMPEVDGFGVLNYLQEHRPGLPVVLMSGMPLNQIQHGIHGLHRHELPPLLIKPVQVEQVLELIEMQLSGGMPEMESPDAPGHPSTARDD